MLIPQLFKTIISILINYGILFSLYFQPLEFRIMWLDSCSTLLEWAAYNNLLHVLLYWLLSVLQFPETLDFWKNLREVRRALVMELWAMGWTMLMTYICAPGQELLLVHPILFTRDESINWSCSVIQIIQTNHRLSGSRLGSIWPVWIKKLEWLIQDDSPCLETGKGNIQWRTSSSALKRRCQPLRTAGSTSPMKATMIKGWSRKG